MTTNNIDRERTADKLSHRKCDTELTDKELGKVIGGSSAGERFMQATLTRGPPPRRSTGSMAGDIFPAVP